MTDDSDEYYDRPMSPGLRSRSPPHRARLKMPNEDEELCVPRGADTQKDFGTLTLYVKLTTHEAAARGAPKSAKRKIFFMTRGARIGKKKRETTLQAASRRVRKNKDFKTGRCKAGRPPDRKVGPRGAKKSFRRREPQVRKKTPKALQKEVRRVLQSQYAKVYKDLRGKFKKVRSLVKKSSEVLLCGRPP